MDMKSLLADLGVGPGDMVAVHVAEQPIVGGWPAILTSRTMDSEDFASLDPREIEGALVAPMKALPEDVSASARAQFAAWLGESIVSAETEGGDGLLLGHDPLNPAERLPASEIGISDDCVFMWDRARGAGPLFEFADVARMVISEDAAVVCLADGRALYLKADVDWRNRLS